MRNPLDGQGNREEWEDALDEVIAETLSPFNRELLRAFLRGENMTERAVLCGRSPDADRKALRRLRDSLPNLAEAIQRRYDERDAAERERYDAEERRANESAPVAEPRGPSAAEVHDWMRAHPEAFPVEEYKRCARQWQEAKRAGDTAAVEGAWISMRHYYRRMMDRVEDEWEAARYRHRAENT